MVAVSAHMHIVSSRVHNTCTNKLYLRKMNECNNTDGKEEGARVPIKKLHKKK